MSGTDPDGVRRARAWAEHLREGGTTTWSDWPAPSGTAAAEDVVTTPDAWDLPGAQQLELLRRVNAAGHPSPTLARAVLDAGAPDRGMPDRDLDGVPSGPPDGPAPVIPERLPDEELLRIATGVLADQLVDRPGRAVPGPFPRPWRVRYRLVGDPALADTWREHLRLRGRPPGGRHPVVLVVGAGLEQMLVDVHRTRIAEKGVPAWWDWVDQLRFGDALPPRVDLPRVAQAWSDRVGPDRVRVVLDHSRLPRLLGVRRLPAPPAGASGIGTEVARRVARVLGVMVPPERRRALVERVLWPAITPLAPGRPVVPEPQREWLTARAARMRDELVGAGHDVVGSPDLLLGPATATSAATSDGELLEVATRLLLRLDRTGGGDW